ncbi:hypothetical protein BG015_009494 [Linnemannia schmuckeri]|uniref:Uncharacterized protein n=1 Tax=Linnemannia schmuckeri TaxID=64567 RepID=A0A9P5V9K0_9FUNG|nr:hypothetical protein BG015_009494 [Linnemannia schmuckeri]
MKAAMISLTVVLGLLVAPINAVPIIAKRDDDVASCPVTLHGPSGNAYFAFSTNLSIQTAREACASCYGGSLANVGAADLQFLGSNLESASWIKAWNGDDYSGSCLTIQFNAGAQPGVGIDANCGSQMWPLCTASTEQAEGLQRIEEEQEAEEETIITLAVPYKQSDAAPTPETVIVHDVALEPTKVDAEDNAVVPDATRPAEPAVTCPKKSDGTYHIDGSCIEAAEEAVAVIVVEEPTKVVGEAKVQEVVPSSTAPAGPCVTCPGHGVVAAEVVLEEPTKVVKDAINTVSPDSTSPAAPCVTCSSPEVNAAEVIVEQSTKVETEANADVVPDATRPNEPAMTCPKKPDGNYETESSCIQSEKFAAAVVVEEPTKIVAEANAVVPGSTGPVSSDVTCPRSVNSQIQTDGCIVHEEAATVVQEEVAAPVAPVAEVIVPAAEPVVPAAEITAPIVAEVAVPAAAEAPAPAPAAAVEAVDALTIEKEKVQAAFEEDTGSCSSQLALGEQDPLVNEYMIETLSETATCSKARQEALAADVQARVTRYEAA